MKRSFAALLAALMWGLCVCGALAQSEITVYISADALARDKAAQLVQLAQRAIPEAAFTAVYEEETGQTLREMVLADRAPQIAICPAREAMPWAKEGLLVPADTGKLAAERIAQAVTAACTWTDEAFMTPLIARHRCVAVNRRLLEAYELDHLLDFRDYPAWLPMQLYQVLEEAVIAGGQAMEIWPADGEDGEAILALVQSLYNGLFLGEDGAWQVHSDEAVSGLEWIRAMADCGLIGVAESRQAALERFLAGNTALFIDWTQAEMQQLRVKGAGTIEVATMPYPSSSGLPVHAFEVVGAAVFRSGDEETDALAAEAAAFLASNAQARLALGDQAIHEDGAMWLQSLGAQEEGAAVQSALCAALEGALDGSMSAQAAMDTVQALIAVMGR